MFRLIVLFAAAVVAAMLYMPKGAPSGVYAMAPAQALAIIDRIDLPPQVFSDFKPAMRHWRPDGATSMWALLGDSDVEMQRFRASVTPEGEGARVRVEALPPQGARHDEVAASMKEAPEYVEFLTAALVERIDAQLTGREFDMKRLAPAFARLQIAAIPRIRRSIDAGAKLEEQRVADTIEDAYAHEHEVRPLPAPSGRRP